MKQISLNNEQLQFLRVLLKRDLKELSRISLFYSEHDKAILEPILQIVEDAL